MRREALALAIAACAGAACVDATEGEQGVYGSPCATGFNQVLLCGRESGGADPNPGGGTTGGGEQPYTCADACQQFADCGFFQEPGDQAQCEAECPAGSNPAQLECIRDAGCSIEQLQVCFGVQSAP